MRNQDVLLPEVVNILVIHWLPRNYGNVNKLRPRASSGYALGLSSFTAIIPWHPVNNYN